MVARRLVVHRFLAGTRMADSLADWLTIIAVIALVIAVYWAVGNMIDGLLDFWRSRKDDA
jgi:hypothetical protein